MKKKILIFGISGLLGSHLERVLKKEFILLGTYSQNPVDEDYAIQFSFSSSLDSLHGLVEDFNPDAIINAAGLVTVDGCEEDPVTALNMNSNFMDSIVLVLNNLSMKNCHLIQISTPAVYGRTSTFTPWLESDATTPLSVYAHSKLLSEYLALKHPGPVTIVRSDVYGINPLSEKSLLWWIIKNAMQGVSMEGWENIYFNPISATRLSKIIGKLIQEHITGVLNIGCLNDCNKYNFAKAVCKNLSLEANIKRSELVDDVIRPIYTITNCSKIYNQLDFGLTWQDDLKLYMEDLPSYPNGKSNF